MGIGKCLNYYVHEEVTVMEERISSGLRSTFVIHAIFATFFGIIYLLIPDVWGNLINWPVQEEVVYRLVGAAVLGYATSSWYSYRATYWEQVRIIVRMEIVWTILGSLVMLYGLILAGLPSFAWVITIILAGFALAFLYFNYRR